MSWVSGVPLYQFLVRNVTLFFFSHKNLVYCESGVGILDSDTCTLKLGSSHVHPLPIWKPVLLDQKQIGISIYICHFITVYNLLNKYFYLISIVR